MAVKRFAYQRIHHFGDFISIREHEDGDVSITANIDRRLSPETFKEALKFLQRFNPDSTNSPE